MRILILTQYFPPEIGAPQVRLAALAHQLVLLGHQVEVVTALPNYPMGRIQPRYRGKPYVCEKWQGILVHRVWLVAATGTGMKRILNYISFALFCLFGLARARRPDCLFVESPPLLTGLPAMLFSFVWQVPFIFNVADLMPDSLRDMGIISSPLVLAILERIEHLIYARAKYVNAVTDGIRQKLIREKGLDPRKTLFLPNGVDIELFKPGPADPTLASELGLDNKRVVLYAGTLGLAQGLDASLEAMQIVRDDLPDLLLLFIGGGSDRDRLIQLAYFQGLMNVRFMEPREPEFVARLYSIAYAGLASLANVALAEGACPSKILPIMASGKPVIYSGFGEGARLIEASRAGIAVPPEDPPALAHAMRALYCSPADAIKMGMNGRCYVEQHLSWPSVIGKWLDSWSIEPSSPRIEVGDVTHVSRGSQS